MIGLDTNILLRATLKDDVQQTQIAADLIKGLTPQRPGYVNLIVLAEYIWTLRRRGYSNVEIARTLEAMLAVEAFVVENRSIVSTAVSFALRESLSLSDALIGLLNQAAQAAPTQTFDRRATKHPLFISIDGAD
jgi:predicted nucleic-acid-binding protein